MAARVRTVTVTDEPTLLAEGGQEWATLRILPDTDIQIGGPDVAATDTGWPVEADAEYDFGSNPQYGDKIYAVTATTADVLVFETGL